MPLHEAKLWNEMKEKFNSYVPWKVNELWPLTIISDRYNGQYSGAKYTAWNVHSEYLPKEPDSGDYECQEFWEKNEWVVGKGNTPNEALTNLYSKLQNNAKEKSNSSEGK